MYGFMIIRAIEVVEMAFWKKKKINPPKTLYYHNQKRDKLKTGRAEIFTYESHWFKKYDFFFFQIVRVEWPGSDSECQKSPFSTKIIH